MSIDLKEVYDFARRAHAGQKYGDDDFITHPMLIALNMDTPLERAVALLHDTVEDTDVTVEQIRLLFGDEVADAVEVLTNKTDHDDLLAYEKYIVGTTRNLTALAVKMEDLRCNLFFCRRRPEYVHLIPRYEKALEYLEAIVEPLIFIFKNKVEG